MLSSYMRKIRKYYAEQYRLESFFLFVLFRDEGGNVSWRIAGSLVL